jgi:hypothetical protein
MKSLQLSTVRDLALIILSTVATAAAVDDLRSLTSRAGRVSGADSAPGRVPTPRPAHGWLYETSSWDNTARRIRPATAAERATSDATRPVDGTGIFALLEDNTIVPSDAADYPPTARPFARYCWAAD